jgi:hypothetical protein
MPLTASSLAYRGAMAFRLAVQFALVPSAALRRPLAYGQLYVGSKLSKLED